MRDNWSDYLGSSAGPHINWGPTARIPDYNDKLLKKSIAKGDNLIIAETEFGSGLKPERVDKLFDEIFADGGVAFRRRVFDRATEITAMLPDGKKDHVWQAGNEILSVKCVENLQAYIDERSLGITTTQLYLYHYLQHVIEALIPLSNVEIMLGSIGGGSSEIQREYIYSLLEKPMLNAFVWEHVMWIDLHYLIGREKNYGPVLWEALALSWGVAETEEIGAKVAQRGYGAAKAMRAFARVMHFVLAYNVPAEKYRCLFHGTDEGPVGSQVIDAMGAVHNFFGDTPLSEIPESVEVPAPDWEGFLFESMNQPNKMMAVISPSNVSTPETEFRVFRIDSIGWTGKVSGSVAVFDVGDTSHIRTRVFRRGGHLVVRARVPIDGERPPTIVIFLSRK